MGGGARKCFIVVLPRSGSDIVQNQFTPGNESTYWMVKSGKESTIWIL